MSAKTRFKSEKVVAGGVRGDADITTADGDAIALKVDDQGRAMTVGACDPVASGTTYYKVLVSRTNQAAATSDHLILGQQWDVFVIPFNISGGVTMKLWTPKNNSSSKEYITHMATLMSTKLSGYTSFVDTSGVLTLEGHFPAVYVELTRSDGTNSETVYYYRKSTGR